MSSPSAALTFSFAAPCAASPPGCCAMRISTVSGVPNCCSWISPSPSPPSVVRSFARSTGAPVLVFASSRVPPTKSMPKLRPTKKYRQIATIESSADAGKLMRRKRMKSNLVSSGTIRSNGMERCRRTSLPASGDRELLGPLPPHPPGHDQARQGEGGEDGRHDADAERDGEAAHRPAAEEEQHRGGDEGGDVGIEDGGERAGEP